MDNHWTERARGLNLSVRGFISGSLQPEAAGELIAKYSPRDGALLYEFHEAEDHDVDRAVAHARHAFVDGRWSKLEVKRRKDLLQHFATLIEKHVDELALLESLDVGKPIRDAVSFDVPGAAAIIRFNSEAADKHYGKVYGADCSSLSYELHRPVGVVAAIVGWNYPLYLAAQKIGPALATGNTLVLKPSELTPLSAVRLAALAMEAGLPEGVLNVIPGGAKVGAALARHHDVDLLSFTGSTRTGKRLLVSSGESNLKRVLLECGGKAPNIVFDDSPDLEAVAVEVARSAFRNQGEVCVASSRLLIQNSVKDKFLSILIDKVSKLKVGDPLQAETTFGPVISRAHQQKIKDYVHAGLTQGGRIAYQCPAEMPHSGGFYVPPSIFTDVLPDHRIAQEEIFGPVVSAIGFRDEAEAIAVANDTIYGLSAIVWTKDLGRAHRVSQSINAGWVVVNATDRPQGGPGVGVLSLAGHKQSGIGVEGGLQGLEEYTSKTAVQFFV
jgi:4-guanidinobutyraldehyde dehydrogenase / NAD-dependent aldehyde dehydrogenase